MAEGLTKSLSIRISVIADNIAANLVKTSDDIRFALKKPIQEATAQLNALKTAMSSMGMKTVGTAKTTATAARATTRDLSSASSSVMDKLTGRVEKLTITVKKLRDELKAVKAEARSMTGGAVGKTTTGAGVTTGGAVGPTSRINEPLFQESKRIQENINLQTKLNNLMRSSGATRGSEFGIVSNLANIEGNVKKLETVLNKARALMQRGFTAKELGFGSTADMEKQFKSAERIIGQYGAKIRQITSEQAKATWLPGTQTGKSASESAKVFNQIEKERTAEMSKQAKLRAQEASSVKQQLKMYEQLRAVLQDPKFNAKELQRYTSMLQSGGTLKGNVPIWAKEIDDNYIKNYNRMKKDFPEFANTIDAMAQKAGVSLGKQYNAVQKYASSIRNFMKFQMEWFAGAGLIFGALAVIRSMASASLEFEQSLKNIQAVTGATDVEIGKLADTAKRVSKETSLAATEIVKIGLQLMRAGLDIKATTGAMEAAAKVAVISGEDVKVVADTMASVFMIWKLGAEDSKEAGTVLAAALNYSKLTIEDFGTALNYVGGMASTMNFSLQETAGVLASMSNLGVRASTMATGWRSFVQEMAAPAGKLGDLLSKLNANFDKLNVTKIEGPHKMATVLAELERVGFGVQEALGVGMEKRVLAFFLALKSVGIPALLKMEEKMSDERAYTEGLAFAMEGLSNKFKNLKNHILLSALSISQAAFPAIKGLVSILVLLANTLAHSISFFTSFPGAIIPIIGGLGTLVILLNNIKNLIQISFVMTVWKQAIGIITTFASVIKVATQNVRFLKFAMESLWIVIARNPIGLIALAITAIVGSALLDWLIKGQTEFEGLSDKADKVTKSSEELRKKGDELKKLYPELFKDMADNAEGAINAMAQYKTRIDEALKVPEFKMPELPDDIKQWVDDNLVPAQENAKELREQLRYLEKQIKKTGEATIEVTWGDIFKAWGKTTAKILFDFEKVAVVIKPWAWLFLKTLSEIAKGWEMIGATAGMAWEKTKAFFTGGDKKQIDRDYADQIAEIKKKWDETPEKAMKSIATIPGGISFIAPVKNEWTKFIESIRASKTPEAKKQLETFVKDYKDIKEDLDSVNADFDEIVKKGNFTKMLEQIIASTKKFTAEERKEMVFKNLTKMIADIAATDPGNVGAVLLGMAEAYMKASEKFDKADKKLGKELAHKMETWLQMERELYKDHIQEMEILQGQELKQLKHQNEMKAIEEQTSTAKLQARWDEETWILETFYNENLMDAKSYYKEKDRLLTESFTHDIEIIRSSGERERSELEKQLLGYASLMQDHYGRLKQIKGEILKTAGTQGPELVNLIEQGGSKENIAKTLENVPVSFQPVVEKQIKEYGDWENKIKELQASYYELQDAIDKLVKGGISKETEALLRNTLAREKNNYEAQIAIALQPGKHLEYQINKQLEYNKIMLAANQLAGNFNEVHRLEAEITKEENILKNNAIDLQLKETKAKIDFVEQLLKEGEALDRTKLPKWMQEFLATSAPREIIAFLEEYTQKNKDLIPILEKLKEAQGKVNEEEERRKIAMSTQRGASGLGFEDALNQWRDYNKQVYDMTKGTFEAMQQTFQTFFFDAMTGQLKTLRDYWRSFTSSIMQMLSQMLSRWLMLQLLKAVGLGGEAIKTTAEVAAQTALTTALGVQTGVVAGLTAAYWGLAYAKAAAGTMGLVMHSGGLVMHSGGLVPELPRYHDGFLAPDERPAILQTGERVLSRKQNKEYEQRQQKQSPPVIVNMHINAIDAKSFEGRIFESKAAVASAIMAAGGDNHPMRRRR